MRKKFKYFILIFYFIIIISLFIHFYFKSLSFKISDYNVILIGICSLRADHLGCYGYDKDTSLFIDKWVKKDCIIFKNSISQYHNTPNSFKSIFTGLYPIRAQGDSLPLHFNKKYGNIHRETITLTEVLKSYGYITAGFTDGAFVSRFYDFHRGFDFYYDTFNNVNYEKYQIKNYWDYHKKHYYKNAGLKVTYPMIKKFLHQVKNKNKPFFLFWHTFDLHSPYLPVEYYYKKESWKNICKKRLKHYENKYNKIIKDYADGNTKEFTGGIPVEKMFSKNYRAFDGWLKNRFTLNDMANHLSRYDECIKYLDDYINKLVILLKKNNQYNNTLIIFIGDHGEVFLPHRNEYNELYNNKNQFPIHIVHNTTTPETVRVPLIIKLPSDYKTELKREIDYYVESGVSILPTILDTIGDKYNLSHYLDGASLLKKNKKKIRTFSKNIVFEFLSNDKYKIYSYPDERKTVYYFDERTKFKNAVNTAVINFEDHQLGKLKLKNINNIKEDPFNPEDHVIKTKKMINIPEKMGNQNIDKIKDEFLKEQLKSLGYL